MRALRYLLPDTRDVLSIVMTEIALALSVAGFLAHQAWLGWTATAVIAVAGVYHAVRYAASLGGFTDPAGENR